MKAISLEQPQCLREIDVPEPPAPGEGEALVRVLRIGICGTDYSGYLGKMPFFSYPRIPGHELGVEVLAVGPGVEGVRAGDLCAVEPYLNCGACFPCQRGNGNCCEHLKVIGVMSDGGMRERLILPARKLHLANGLAPEQCALVETLAIGCHAVHRGQPAPGDNLVVIGAGPIGLSVLEFAKLSEARVFVMDTNEQRLAFVRERMGIRDTIAVKGDGSDLAQLEAATDGRLAQVVIDATGSNQSMGHALNYVGFTGRLVYVGITTREISFAHALMHRREMTLLASRNAHSRDFPHIIGLITEGRIDTRPWITHRAPFAEVTTAFPRWLQPESGVIKAVVEL